MSELLEKGHLSLAALCLIDAIESKGSVEEEEFDSRAEEERGRWLWPDEAWQQVKAEALRRWKEGDY